MRARRGRPWIPQHDQEPDGRLSNGPWRKYLQYFDEGDPARYPILRTFRLMELSGVEITDETAAAAVKLGQYDHARIEIARREAQEAEERYRDRAEKLTARLPDNPEGIVYYLRRGNFIKIGTTSKPRKRFAAIAPDEVLAFEPGSYTVEHRRHAQFRESRLSLFGSGPQEWFHPEADLIAHIRRLREEHGEPEDFSSPISDGRKLLEELEAESA